MDDLQNTDLVANPRATVSFTNRAFTYLLDILLCVGVAWGVAWSIEFMTSGAHKNFSLSTINQKYYWLVLFTPIVLSLPELTIGKSPAKALRKMRILNYDGSLPHPRQLWIRFGLKFASQIFALIALVVGQQWIDYLGRTIGTVLVIGFFMILSQSRRGLHDRISGTAVFHI